MGFRRIGRWQRDLGDLVFELEAARLACEDAKKKRKAAEFSLKGNAKRMRELFELFWAASGDFIDLGSADFYFTSTGTAGAMTDYSYSQAQVYGRDFGFSD